jgi:hypothetical protein
MKYFLFVFVLFSCEEKKNDNQTILIGLAIFNSSRNTGVDFNCGTAPSPKNFSEFTETIDRLNTSTTKCSGCHGATTATANFIITSYTSVTERASANNPNGSLLYLKVKSGGTMAQYSNSDVTKSIYCYINNGLSR